MPEIEYVFHISDIHIKMENVTNIKNSFIKLINSIILQGVEKSLLAIVGDVFENKTYLTTDEIYIFYWMIEGLIKNNIKTIIIPGNHDYNINSTLNKNNIDVLVRKYPNIICLSDTQIYTIDNIDFYIFSPIDKQTLSIKASDNIKVALLHEPLNNATYDNGELIADMRFSANDFQKFDYVMLGDIHKPQFLKKNIAYSGSFVQKNKGEGLEHGYILWDLINKTGSHIFIPLKEVYVKIEAKNDDCILPTIEKTQNIKYVSFYHSNCTNKYVTKVRNIITKTYGFINKIVNKDNYAKSYKPINLDHSIDGLKDAATGTAATGTAATNATDIDLTVKKDDICKEINQIELIKQMLEKQDPATVTKIINFHNQKLQNRKEINYTRYKLNYLYWSNILCYGPDNYIDFRNFKQKIVLLNGKNKQGKSSVIDILIRILFNECVRGYKEDIINKKKQRGDIKLSFSIGSDEYIIEQVIHNNNKNKSHKLLKNGENITKCSIGETYKFLTREIGIGEYKDFLNMTTALQNRQFLVDIDKKDLLLLLTKILNIDILHDLEKETKTEINTLKRLNKIKTEEYNRVKNEICDDSNELEKIKTKIDSSLSNVNTNINKINIKLQKLNKKFDSKILFEDNIYEEINLQKTKLGNFELCIKKKESTTKILKESIIRYELLKEKLNNTNTHTNTIDVTIPEDKVLQFLNNNAIIELEPLFKQLNNRCSDFEEEPFKPDFYDEYTTYKDYVSIALPDYKTVKNNKRILLENIESFNKNFGILTYDKNCACCANNENNVYKLYDIEKNKIELNRLECILTKREASEVKYRDCVHRISIIDEYNRNIIDFKILNDITATRHHNEKINSYNRILEHIQYNKNKQEIEFLPHTIEECKEYLYKYELYKKYIDNIKIIDSLALNEDILKQLQILKEKLVIKELKRYELTNKQLETSVKINFLKIKTHQKEILEKEQEDNLNQISFLEIYYNCINHKTGIPTVIVKNLCNVLNTMCNYILHKISDFELEIIYDKEFKFYTKENDIIIPATMGSGYQKFVIDMIMRITLTRISILSSPNIIFIDEGFGSLDRENFILISNILAKLKNNFDAMFIITHIDELKAYADISININRIQDYSVLKYGSLNVNETQIATMEEIKENNKEALKFKKSKGEFKPIDIDIDISELEKILIIKELDTYKCIACNKDYKLCKGSILKHLSGKTNLKKHKKKFDKLTLL